MKNWAFAATVFVLGTSVLTIAYAQSTPPPRALKTLPFQGVGGRDVSQSAWQSWQAPVGTVDPERLIPSDSTNSVAVAGLSQSHFDSFKSDSFQLANTLNNGNAVQIEESKPIEKINGNTDSPNQSTPLLATAAPKPKSDSKRIIVIATISVAVLAYRKFRRANASPYPPKPNFL